MTTHQVDAMRWLAGDVVEVYARYARRVTDDVPKMTVPDVQVATLEFASGAVGYVSTSCVLTRGGYGSAYSGHDWRTCGRSPCACWVTDSLWGMRGLDPALSRMYYVERWGSVQMKVRQLSLGRAEVSESGE